MTFLYWPKQPRPPIRPPARARLAVEQLEERAVPTTTVNTLLDETTPNDGLLSLREAVTVTNQRNGADTIFFAPGLSGTIKLNGGELLITGSVTITGPGLAVITVRGNGASRIFEVDNNAAGGLDVTISGLTLTGGKADDGGAIAAGDGALTLNGVGIIGNTATDAGGGIAIGSNDQLTLVNSIVAENTAAADGGGIQINASRLTLVNSTVSGNAAGQGGGGIAIGGNGQLTLENSIVSANHAEGPGGGLSLEINSVTLIGNSTISGNSSALDDGGGAFVDAGGSLTVTNSTISGNSASTAGGGIEVNGSVLAILNSTIANNSASTGGGVNAESAATTTVENSTVSGNSAVGDGGGIRIDAGRALVRNSTISGNKAERNGGGIFSPALSASSLTVENSTVAFNTADSDNAGGGNGGGLFVRSSAAVALLSTIVADNAVGATGANPDVSGTVTAAFSLIENVTGTTFAAGSAANLTDLDPRLGPLQFNGGPTQTHALLPGSPAIDHGSDAAGLAFDQRGPGFARVRGAAADIGAFEANPPPQIVAVAFRRKGVARVRVLDAATGAVRAVLTPFKGFGGRLRLQLLDVNGDGALDLIVRALVHGKRRKKVYDAVTLATLPPGLA